MTKGEGVRLYALFSDGLGEHRIFSGMGPIAQGICAVDMSPQPLMLTILVPRCPALRPSKQGAEALPECPGCEPGGGAWGSCPLESFPCCTVGGDSQVCTAGGEGQPRGGGQCSPAGPQALPNGMTLPFLRWEEELRPARHHFGEREGSECEGSKQGR